MDLPSRIWVVGPCGSGKTFVADRLAARTGVAAVHLDELHHLPGWVELPAESLRAKVEAITIAPAWIVDGNYRAAVGELRRARADLVVWLDLPFHVTVRRVLFRTLRRIATGETCCNGNRESVRRAFFHRESILWWAVTTHGRYRRSIAIDLTETPYVRLRSTRDVAVFLESSGDRRRLTAEQPRP